MDRSLAMLLLLASLVVSTVSLREELSNLMHEKGMTKSFVQHDMQ